MSSSKRVISAAQRYNTCRFYARDGQLSPDYVTPRSTSAWPPENIALLERYREWLLSGGASEQHVQSLYIPMAGNALGLNLKPHPEIDLDLDLERGLDYVKAKGMSDAWIDMCRNALEKFRRFLRQERRQPKVVLQVPDLTRYQAGLPDWLVEQLQRYQRLRQRNWRPARVNELTRRFWSGHVRLWRWLVECCAVDQLADVRRQHILDYVDHRLASGYSASGINNDLRCLYGLLHFLQDQDFEIPQVLFRLPSLKQPDSLPKFLTDEQVCLLRDEIEARVPRAGNSARRRDALLNRAAFYLLWQGGLRLGELEELQLEDLDLAGCRIIVRKGKGLNDRSVYLTGKAVCTLKAYLSVRGLGSTDHVFLYRNEPLKKDLVRDRLRAIGQRIGVNVYPHRLRHTCATQLLNAGCRVTSIQKFLGHQRLNSTMIYARVHDRTVAEDYYAAMEVVEKRLEVAAPEVEDISEPPVNDSERAHLLGLATRLAEPELSIQMRLDLVDRMCQVLNHRTPSNENQPTKPENGTRPLVTRSPAGGRP